MAVGLVVVGASCERDGLWVQNTVCGRNPIHLLLQILAQISTKDGKDDFEFVFVRYEQSSKAESGSDSSVSYVSGVLRPKA